MPAIELDYTNRDYASIRQFLVSTAQGLLPEWVTAGEPGDFGTLLLELYAYAGDVTNYYIDRVAAEPFLASAQRRISILAIADMLGYRPIAKQAATGTATLTLTSPSYGPLTISEGTVIRTQALREEDAIYFETASDVVLPTDPDGFLSADVVINEGRTITDEFVAASNGAPLQTYVLVAKGVIQRSVGITVVESDGATVAWSFVDRISDAGPDTAAFTTFVDEQQFLHVLFGDNAAGRIPAVGAQIYATYRYGAGFAGNVAAHTILELASPIPGVGVDNTLPTAGGADDESIDSMRYSIPRAVKMRDRAVTIDDFANLAYQVPGVGKACAEGQFYTLVHVRIAPVGGGAPSQDLKDRVGAYLLERSLVGVSVIIEDPLYTVVEVSMTVHVLAQYGQERVMTEVDRAIETLFAFDNVGFNDIISIGEVYRTAMSVAGVDYVDLTIMRVVGDTGPVEDITTDAQHIPAMDDAHRIITAVGGVV